MPVMFYHESQPILILKTEETMAEAEPSLINQRWSLKGMTALVTGGTRGIGLALNLFN